jgi:TonB family protein
MADAPASLTHAANSASVPATPAASVAVSSAGHLHDVIATKVNFDLRDTASYHNGTVAQTFYLGSNENEVVSEPKLVHVVNRSLREQDAVPGKADVTVAMRVSAEGVPTDLKIVRSAGAEVDKDTLAAVSQYRFTPGMLNHLPAEAGVTVRIQLAR